MNYIVSGKDEYLVNQKVEQVIENFLPENDYMNKVYYDSLSLSWQMVVDDAGTFSFFGDKKVIVVENCWFLTGKDSLSTEDEKILTDYLNDSNPSSVVILTVASLLDGRKSLVKNLRKICQCIEIEPLSSDEFAGIVIGCLRGNVD